MSTRRPKKATKRQALVAAALGHKPCDLILRDVRYFDVFSCQWHQSDVALSDGFIVALDRGLKAKREISGSGKYLVPGFIDAHVHVESSMMSPSGFQKAVLPCGTTTAISDPHELANVQGVPGIKYFLKAAEKLALDLRVTLSSCVPATDFETNGAGHLKASHLLPLARHPKVIGLGEMMNVPGVLNASREVWEKLAAFADIPIDGHCPLLTGSELSAYACAGISSCHESTQLNEAQEKLTKGLAVWIREGSVTKDLEALAPLLTVASSARVGFCTDDRNPLDIATEGHVDYLVRRAIALGVPMEAVYRASSWTVARHYGLRDVGAIAPGYRADLVLLADAKACAIEDVFLAGQKVSEMDLPNGLKSKPPNSIRAVLPRPEDLEGPSGKVHVIGIQPGRILTGRSVEAHNAPGVARLSVLERYGKKSPPANAYVRGFGNKFHGAIASSVGHDSHNLIVVGSNTKDMQVALKALQRSGGGYSVTDQGQLKAILELPLGGLMCDRSASEIHKELVELRRICRELGCELDEPFLHLAFLSLPVIPSLKLTDRGLVDVDAFKIISVRA